MDLTIIPRHYKRFECKHFLVIYYEKIQHFQCLTGSCASSLPGRLPLT